MTNDQHGRRTPRGENSVFSPRAATFGAILVITMNAVVWTAAYSTTGISLIALPLIAMSVGFPLLGLWIAAGGFGV